MSPGGASSGRPVRLGERVATNDGTDRDVVAVAKAAAERQVFALSQAPVGRGGGIREAGLPVTSEPPGVDEMASISAHLMPVIRSVDACTRLRNGNPPGFTVRNVEMEFPRLRSDRPLDGG